MRALYRINIGIGDHVICKGIFNNIPSKYDEIVNIVQEKYKNSLSHLYDPNRVKFVNEQEFRELTKQGYFDNLNPEDFFLYGCSYVGKFEKYRVKPKDPDENFMIMHYEQAKIPIGDSWRHFSIDNRDIESENKLLKKYGHYKKFIHNDPKRGFLIKQKYKLDEYIWPDPNITDNIFNWIGVIKNCEEIHCIDSSFLNIIDRLELNPNVKLYLHEYARPGWQLPILKKDWIRIKDESNL